MPALRNLSPNPACQVSATGWSSSPAGYARYAQTGDVEIITWAGNSASGSASSRAVADDAAMIAGDVRYAAFSISNETITTPAGWALVGGAPLVIASTRRIYVFRRVHEGGTEPSSTTFTFSGTANHTMQTWAGRGADTTNPDDVVLAADSNTSGTAVAAPSRTVVSDGAALISLHYVIANGAEITLSLPSGMTSIATGAGTGSAGHAFRVAYEIEDAGASGVRTSTSSTSTVWGAAAFVIRPAPADTDLPRPTGFTGTDAADVNTPRAAVTAGQQYVFSLSVEALAGQQFGASVNWYSTPSSGGSYLGNTGAVGQDAMLDGDTTRVVIGPYTAPVGAQGAQFKLNGVDAGGIRVTAVRVAPSTGDLALDSLFFDGDTAGATWDGTEGSSTSTWRLLADTWPLTETFSIAETALGPVGADTWPATEAFSVVASGAVADDWAWRDGFLIASLEFDPTRGRVRLEAFTFPAEVAAMRVRSRTVGGAWAPVRGGIVSVLDGHALRPVDDYEYAAGHVTDYLIEGIDEGGTVLASAQVSRDGAADRPWLKVIADPASNRRIVLLDEVVRISRPSRQALYDVQGRSDPVVVSDVAGSRRFTVRLVATGDADADALEATLALGAPVYLQVPPGGPIPSVYASIGDVQRERTRRGGTRWIFTLPVTEVAPPPATVAGSFATYARVLADHASYDALLDAVGSYRELAS